MAFDAEGAKKAGYSDTEIADYLAQENKFDASAARKSGYSDTEIIDHLSPTHAPPKSDEPKRKTPLQRASEIVKDTAREAVAPLKADFEADKKYASTRRAPMTDAVESVTKPFEPGGLLRGFKEVGDVAGAVAAPINKPIHAATEAVKKATGGIIDIEPALAALPAEGGLLKAADAAKAVGEAGEAAGATRAANQLKERTQPKPPPRAQAAEEKKAQAASPKVETVGAGDTGGTKPLRVTNSEAAIHHGSVAALSKEGVDLTSGQRAGGLAKRLEETQKSNPLIGQAIREREQNSLGTFNVATYNKALKPLGIRLTAAPVGREGVSMVAKVIGDRYDRIEPKLRAVVDPELAHEVGAIKDGLLPAMQEEFSKFIKARVTDRMKDGTLTGKEFKQVESEISNKARNYSSSTDAAQRDLGEAFEGTLGALRSNLERHAAPEVRDELKALNTSWAMYKRIEAAAANRVTTGGKFSTGDLLGAVKRMDKSTGKGAFARGDALLQDWADMGHRVLANVVPDSGTPERLHGMGGGTAIGAGLGGIMGGPIGAAAGGAVGMMGDGLVTSAVTPIAKNLLAAHARSLMRDEKAVAPGSLNFLARATNRSGQHGSSAAKLLAAANAVRAAGGSNQPTAEAPQQ